MRIGSTRVSAVPVQFTPASPAQAQQLAAAIADAFVVGSMLNPAVVASIVRAQRASGVSQAQNNGPAGEAQSFMRAESQRLEAEKYNFSPETQAKVDKFNAGRELENDKVRAKASKVDDEIAKVETDPKISPSDRAKKLGKLLNKRAEILKEIKPPIDLARTTHEIDTIMNDPSLSDGDKKKRIEAVKKRLGIPDHEVMGLTGGINMHDLFTGRLGRLYRDSANRVKKHGEAQKKELQQQLAVVEKTYGKNSAEAVGLRAHLDSVDKMHKQEEGRLRKIGDTLYDMYRPRSFWESLGSFFGGIFKAIGKIVDFVMPIVKLIPGVGQIAGAIWGGVKAVGNLVTGNWKGVLESVLDVIPGVGGVLGKVAGGIVSTAGKVIDIAKKGFNAIRGGINTVGALIRGDVGGALKSAAGVAGTFGGDSVANVLSQTGQVASGVQRVAGGDVIGGLQELGGGALALAPAPVERFVDEAGHVVNQVQSAVGEAIAPVTGVVRQIENAVDEQADALRQQMLNAMRTIRI